MINIYTDYEVLDLNKLTKIDVSIENEYDLLGKNYNLKEKYVDSKDNYTFNLEFFCNKQDKYYIFKLLSNEYFWLNYKCNVFKTYLGQDYNGILVNEIFIEKGYNYNLDDSNNLFILIPNFDENTPYNEKITKVLNIDNSNTNYDILTIEPTILNFNSSNQYNISFVSLCYCDNTSVTFNLINENIYKLSCSAKSTNGVIESINIYTEDINDDIYNVSNNYNDILIPFTNVNGAFSSFVSSDYIISSIGREKFDYMNNPRLLSNSTNNISNINKKNYDYSFALNNLVNYYRYIDTFAGNNTIYNIAISGSSIELHKNSYNMIFESMEGFEKSFFSSRSSSFYNKFNVKETLTYSIEENRFGILQNAKYSNDNACDVSSIVLATNENNLKGMYLNISSIDFKYKTITDKLIELYQGNFVSSKISKGIVKKANGSKQFKNFLVMHNNNDKVNIYITNENGIEKQILNIDKNIIYNNDIDYVSYGVSCGYEYNNEYILIFSKAYTDSFTSSTKSKGITVVRINKTSGTIVSNNINDVVFRSTLISNSYNFCILNNNFYLVTEKASGNGIEMIAYKYDLNLNLIASNVLGNLYSLTENTSIINSNFKTLHTINNTIYINYYLNNNKEQNNVINIIDENLNLL